jgi:hypothetical protein
VWNIKDPFFKVQALAALVSYLPENSKDAVLYRAMEDIQSMKVDEHQCRSITTVAPFLSEPLLRKALEIVGTIETPLYQVQTLAALAPRLQDTYLHKDGILFEILTTLLTNQHIECLPQAVISLISYLPDSLLREALDITYMIGDRENRNQALVIFATHLGQCNHPSEALDVVWKIEGDEFRTQALSNLIPYLSKRLLQSVQPETWGIQSKVHQMRLLSTLALRLAQLGNLNESWNILKEFKNEKILWLQSLEKVVPHLSPSLLSKVLDTIQECYGASVQVQTFAYIAPFLSESLLQKALRLVRKIRFSADEESQKLTLEGFQVQALAHLVPFLSESLLQKSLKLMREMHCETSEQYLVVFVGRLVELGSTGKAWSLLKELKDEFTWLHGLENIAPCLSSTLLSEALDIIQKCHRASVQVQALRCIGPFLSQHLLHKALKLVRAIDDKSCRTQALVAVLPQKQTVLAIQRQKILKNYNNKTVYKTRKYATQILRKTVEDKHQQIAIAQELIALGYPNQAFISEMTTDDRFITEVLMEIIPSLSNEYLSNTITAAQVISDEHKRTRVLTALSSRLKQSPTDDLYPIWCKALRLLTLRTRADFLSDLCAFLAVLYALGEKKVLEEIISSILDVGRWWP